MGPRLRSHLKLSLLAVSASLLTLSFAPFKQFYLAWFALAPMFIVWADARSPVRAAGWGGLAGVLFFGANLSYLVLNTIPGAAALVVYEALFWAMAAAVVRVAIEHPKPRPSIAAVVVACSWITFDWLRGHNVFGLPWLYFGYTQSPLPVVCQVADFSGVYGVTFWLILLNATIAIAVIHRTRAITPWVATACLVFLVSGYGWFRLAEQQTSPGPVVMVVQPNDPMTPGGGKSVTQEQSLQFHLASTLDALASRPVDLIAWSETTMPPLNQEARDALRSYPSGQFLDKVHSALRGVTATADAGLIAGGYYVGGWEKTGGKQGTDIRNAAFFYDRAGRQQGRYDKIHLVPFGEFTPFREGLPVVHRLFRIFRPNDEGYRLSPGEATAAGLTVFTLQTRDGISGRFVAPICFDDIDSSLMASMFRTPDGSKRADFIVNLTNDGWFHWFEPEQHLQAAVFRSIENRAPTARTVNTGVSAFIDSCGRVQASIPAHTSGTFAQRLTLDRRVTFYTRYDDAFAYLCMIVCGLFVASVVVRRWKRRAQP